MDGCGDDEKHYYRATTIEKLRIIFATHGLPRKIVTDNGPSFTSNQFMSKNGILHITAPHHAERAVQSFKLGIKRTSGDSIQDRLSRYLFKYRITLHTTTGGPPAELRMGRRLPSRLYPELSQKVQSQQLKQKRGHDNTKTLCYFQVGDLVFAENFSDPSPKWLAGNVLKTTGLLSYEVELQSGIVVRRHIDNIRGRKSPSSPLSDEDQPKADSSSQTDPAADDLVDPLTLPDLPADPVNPPETHGVLPVPSPPNPPARKIHQDRIHHHHHRHLKVVHHAGESVTLRVFESLYDPKSSLVFNYRL